MLGENRICKILAPRDLAPILVKDVNSIYHNLLLYKKGANIKKKFLGWHFLKNHRNNVIMR